VRDRVLQRLHRRRIDAAEVNIGEVHNDAHGLTSRRRAPGAA
jgi:hypothetical protein